MSNSSLTTLIVRSLCGLALQIGLLASAPVTAAALVDACNQLLMRTYANWSLGNRSNAELQQMYAELLPVARGVVEARFDDVLQAHQKLRQIGYRLGSIPKREPSPQVRIDDNDILLHEPILRISEHSERGFNLSYLVEFSNHRLAIFKPFLGQRNFFTPSQDWRFRIAFTREVSAVDIIEDFLGNAEARRLGLSPLELPATQEILLVHDGISYGLGSIQMYLQGFDSSAPYIGKPGWSALEARVRTLDFLLGNPDRLSNFGLGIPHYATPNYSNLMIDKANKNRVAMIDNAFGRPGRPEFSRQFAPATNLIPEDLAVAILHFDNARFRRTYDGFLPPEGLEDFLSRIQTLRSEFKASR